MTPDYRYEIILYWSKEDQAFIAEVPELQGADLASLTGPGLRRRRRNVRGSRRQRGGRHPRMDRNCPQAGTSRARTKGAIALRLNRHVGRKSPRIDGSL